MHFRNHLMQVWRCVWAVLEILSGRYSSLGVDAVYKVSVNLLGVTESKPRERQMLFNLCCPSFTISLHAQHSGEHFLWIENTQHH